MTRLERRLLARVIQMGAFRFVSMPVQRIKNYFQRHGIDSSGEPLESEVGLVIDPAEVARRRRERSRFSDDAAYFDSLIERAVRTAASELRKPETS